MSNTEDQLANLKSKLLTDLSDEDRQSLTTQIDALEKERPMAAEGHDHDGVDHHDHAAL